MTERFVENGELTSEGRKLASKMATMQCDRRPCVFCSKRNISTLGPGGSGCPTEGTEVSGGDIEEILTLYIGRPPGHEALDALIPKR